MNAGDGIAVVQSGMGEPVVKSGSCPDCGEPVGLTVDARCVHVFSGRVPCTYRNHL